MNQTKKSPAAPTPRKPVPASQQPVGDSVFLGLLTSLPVTALIGTLCYAFWGLPKVVAWAIALVLLLVTVVLFLLRKPFAVLGMWLSLMLWLGLSVLLYVGWCGYQVLQH